MRSLILGLTFILALVSCSKSEERDYHSYIRSQYFDIPLEGHHMFYVGRAYTNNEDHPPYTYQFYCYEKGVKPLLHADGSVYRYPKEGYLFHLTLSCYNPDIPEAGIYNPLPRSGEEVSELQSYLIYGERAQQPDSSAFFFQCQGSPVELQYRGEDLILDIESFSASLYQDDKRIARDVEMSLHFEGPMQNVINKL